MKLERRFVALYKAVLFKHKQLFEGRTTAEFRHRQLCLELSEVEMQLDPDVTGRLIQYVVKRYP